MFASYLNVGFGILRKTAKKHCNRNTLDAAVIDYFILLEMTGSEICKKIKADKDLHPMKLDLFTGNDDVESRKKARKPLSQYRKSRDGKLLTPRED